MTFKTIKDMDVEGKTILLRADLNVPVQDGRVTDTTRIDRLKPTIEYLHNHGARVLIMSHFGRPDGERNSGLSLAFLTKTLQECWAHPVQFCQTSIGEQAQSFANSLQNGDIGLLENIRFHKEEKENDAAFAEKLAALGDIYVNDAFSCSHRAHASIEAIAHHLPAVAGLLMEEELNALDQALGHPQKPVAAVAGGSKISTKLSVLYNLSERVDYLILGGGMANTFLHAQGADLGNSLCEKDMAEEAQKIMAQAEKNGCEIILPMDLVAVEALSENASSDIVPADKVPDGKMAVDCGPNSIQNVLDKIKDCKTIVWNGPLGVFEIKPFDQGTNALAAAIAEKTKSGNIISIAGGGDTVAALENAQTASEFTYISTAGGAFLEWLEGKELPGVKVLESTA